MKLFTLLLLILFSVSTLSRAETPNIVLVMSDDQGWGQVGYMGHSRLKTPNLDEMAKNGLRFDRFYAGASNCSPSRATVLTGRSNDRTGVQNHGFPLRLQEKTVAQALADAGYATGHFGKWHLNGLRGPGVPILGEDTHSPGAFGFQHWLSVTNFFDRNPILSRGGEFEEFAGDSSEVVIDEALKFIREKSAADQAVFAVVWYGTPHDPMVASEEDKAPFADLPEVYANQLGELVAMDRSIGTLRKGLRDIGIADNTLFWFCSDNGGLPKFPVETVGGLRGSKNTMYEGGLRVPGIIEWPAKIKEGRQTSFPAGTVDMFPTIAEVVGLPDSSMLQPQDGISLVPLIKGEVEEDRPTPLRFRHDGRGVLINNNLKYLTLKGEEMLFDLVADPDESEDLSNSKPKIFAKMKSEYEAWNTTVESSVAGKDYPEGKVDPNQPERRFWTDEEVYKPYFEEWKDRPEYSSRLKPASAKKKKKAKK